MHDGPGVRTTVFLKGCPLRCAWCHNPETQARSRELLLYQSKCIRCRACEDVCQKGGHDLSCEHTVLREHCTACGECESVCPTGALAVAGRWYTVEELLAVIGRDRAFYGETGGVTLSGGEPLMQGEATLALLSACKAAGYSTAVETCGYADAEILLSAIADTDLFLWDIKDTDDARHREYTGVDTQKIRENLILADAYGARTRLRCILINGINTQTEHYRAIGALARSLARCEGVELLAYHAYAGSKATFLGRADNSRVEWIPDERQMKEARRTLIELGVRVL